MAFHCPIFKEHARHNKGLWCKNCVKNPKLKGDKKCP